MKNKRIVFVILMLLLAYGPSSCEKLVITGHTVGLIKFIRPDVFTHYEGEKTAVFENTRFLEGTEIEIGDGGRSTILFDNGVKVAVDTNTRLRVNAVDDITCLSGRLFIDADEKEQMAVQAGGGKFSVIGSGVSLQVGEGQINAYTYSGELTYNFPGGNGVVRAGESLTLKGNNVEIKPEELWIDWTGGMAEAGPRAMESLVSIGQIYARLPGAAGEARWPLIIRRHEVRVTIKGDLAVTETMQEFFNPSSYTTEGIYRLSIPADAMLQRFAVDRNNKLVDGFIKEKRAAKQEYDSYVYQGSTYDPALLEWVAPGSFRARIYPIKPGQVRTIAYRYSQWLKPSGKEGDIRTYVYPVGNETIAPKIGEFYFVADVSGAGTEVVQAGAGARIEKGRVVFAQSDFRPRSDFYIQLMDVQKELKDDEILMVKADYRGMVDRIKGERPESYAFTQFVLRDEAFNLQAEKNLKISIALDMSAATEQHLVDLAVTFVESLFGKLHEGDQVAVFAGDVDAKIVGQDEKKLQKPTEDVKAAIMDAVARHSIGGATDIGKLIMESASVSAKEPGGIVIYIGDGFPTVGELDIGGLKERLKRLPNPVRMYGIALGDEANLDLLAGLCTGRGQSWRIENRVEAAEAAVSLLADATTPVIESVKYEIDGGIERVYPAEITTLKITEPVQLIAKLTGEKDPQKVTVKGSIKGKAFTKEYEVKLKDTDDLGDLRLRWAKQRLLKLLEEQEGPESVIELGTRFGIITPYTSFYVPPADMTYDLPEAPPFQIFQLLEGTDYSANETAGGETTLAEAVFGIFLPYGCSRKEDRSGAPPEYLEKAAEEKRVVALDDSLDEIEDGKDKRHKAEEGQMGELGATKTDNMYGIKGPAAEPEMAAEEEAKREAAEAPGDFEISGSGLGGGGTGEGTIGLGNLGTIGHGGGGGSGVGYGKGTGGLREKGSGDVPKIKPGNAVVKGNLSKEVIRRVIRQHINEVRYCYEQQLASYPDLSGEMSVQFIISPTGAVQMSKLDKSTLGNAAVEGCVVKRFRSWTFPAPEGGGVVIAKYPFTFLPSGTAKLPAGKKVKVSSFASPDVDVEVSKPKEKPKEGEESYTKTTIYFEQETYSTSNVPIDLSGKVKKCTEASLMPVDEKKLLWKERLGSSPSLVQILQVFKQAKKNCEIKTGKDRRVFARIALGLLGSVHSKCQFYKKMKTYPSLAKYIKKKILSSLVTPDAVKTAMEQCEGAVFLTEDEVDKMLEKIKDMDGKIVALKKLIKLYPNDLKLKIRLLDMLEDAGRKEEAVRFADAMRSDPYASDEVRTRVGEFFIRIDDKEQAKRVLSEIVEFAPWSYKARRRLGDLYRAYGWYEDAYRQYETLSKMAPNDDAVLILLAEAAILAGRSDEGLRVLEQVSQSEPSFEGKISPSEVARVLASLTLTKMRVEARKDGDKKRLKKLVERTRKAGVLRDAGDLRVVLKWDHPDVGFNLSIKFPGSELSKPFKSAPSLGLQWITEKSKPAGDVLLQVERTKDSVIKESKATLYVIVKEGEDDESIQTLKIAVTDKKETKKAWTISPDGKIAESKTQKAEPL